MPSAPATKKVTTKKAPCSLCHQVVEELKYHYDICGPCHESNEAELTESQDEDDAYDSDEDCHSEWVEGDIKDHANVYPSQGRPVEELSDDEEDVFQSDEEQDDEAIAEALCQLKRSNADSSKLKVSIISSQETSNQNGKSRSQQ